MNFNDFIDKYIEEPIRMRKSVNIEDRLQYKNAPPENNTKLLWVGISPIVILVTLWLLDIIDSNRLFCYIIFVPIILVIVYQYKPRYCKTCSNKMVRQQHSPSMYYFCDNCKTKIITTIGTDASG
jgi:hypothetical protein